MLLLINSFGYQRYNDLLIQYSGIFLFVLTIIYRWMSENIYTKETYACSSNIFTINHYIFLRHIVNSKIPYFSPQII